MDVLDEWRSGGTEIKWRSTTAANDGAEVTVFSRRCGTPGAPALVCVHGFPTASVDYFALTRELDSEFDIYLLDFPGYGLSDKPAAPYVYSLYDDARLLVHAITSVWQLNEYTMLTHDRGTSIGMIALPMFDRAEDARPPAEVILTNANIYLPLANLTEFQKALLDPHRGPQHRARNHAGDAGRRDGRDDLHATARRGRSRNRRAGKVLRAQRRDRGAARYDSISQRARR